MAENSKIQWTDATHNFWQRGREFPVVGNLRLGEAVLQKIGKGAKGVGDE